MYLIVRPKKILSVLLVLLVILLFAAAALQLEDAAAFSTAASVPVVMYHHVSTDPAALGKYVVSAAELESDLIWLRDRGYTTLTVSDLIDYQRQGMPLPEKCIVLTFDDGQESFRAYVYPLLQKYDMCAVVNVVGAFVEQYSGGEDHNPGYACLTWDELAEMTDSGFVEVGNHTYSMHGAGGREGAARLPGESDAEYAAALSSDVERLQQALEQATGRRPCTFAYPYGTVAPGSRDILAGLGFQALLTCEERLNDPTQPDWLMRLGRFNRPSGVTSRQFFGHTMGLA